MGRRSFRSPGAARRYPRTARLNHLIQEIVAEEIEQLDDARLGLLTVTAVDVEPDLHRATVFYTAMAADDSGPPDGALSEAVEERAEVREALAEHRAALQAAIARQARLKRTPELVFEPDAVVRQAERVEEILRGISARQADDA
jgi:ribosome-binding factor A